MPLFGLLCLGTTGEDWDLEKRRNMTKAIKEFEKKFQQWENTVTPPTVDFKRLLKMGKQVKSEYSLKWPLLCIF